MYKRWLMVLPLGLGVAWWLWHTHPHVTVHESTVRVHRHQDHPSMMYASRVAPLHTHPVTAPVSGRLQRWLVPWGQVVKRQQPVAEMTSPSMHNDYAEAVVTYLKAKDQLTRQRARLKGDRALWQAGVLSDREFQQQQHECESLSLDFVRAELKLKAVAQLLGEPLKPFERLQLADAKAMMNQLDRAYRVQVRSPVSGVLLMVHSQDQKPTGVVGSKVERGQVVASIADMTGIRLSLMVGEQEVKRLKPGMSCQVTSQNWPGLKLRGQVTQVHRYEGQWRRANVTFPVDVEVSHLDQAAQAQVMVGTQAHVTIHLPARDVLSVPVSAVHQDAAAFFVWLPHRVKRVVQLGRTMGDQVVVTAGLQAGDQVMVADVR